MSKDKNRIEAVKCIKCGQLLEYSKGEFIVIQGNLRSLQGEAVGDNFDDEGLLERNVYLRRVGQTSGMI